MLQRTKSPSVQPHRSPGLTGIFNELKHSNRNRVLDLGSSSATNFNFFTQLSCNIHFESLDDLLCRLKPEHASGPALIAELEHYLSRFDDHEKFDVILTWDVFNYLDLEGIYWLINRLNAFCHSNTLMHAVKYVGTQIPIAPQKFQIIDQYQLRVTVNEPAPRRLNNHSTVHLLRHMPHYYLENSYLNYSGMIPSLAEHVFRYLPERKAHARKQTSDELSSEINPSPTEGVPSRVSHQSAALHSLCNQLKDTPTSNVLDLGLKNRNNYDFWMERVDNFYTENLFQQLGQQSQVALRSHQLNFSQDLQFDVILAWDILNYLSTEQIKAIFRKLHAHTHAGSKLHVILYCGREISVQPQKFYLTNDQQLAMSHTCKQPNPNPLTLSTLLKALQDYTLVESYVYRPGMQRGIYEYIFAAK